MIKASSLEASKGNKEGDSSGLLTSHQNRSGGGGERPTIDSSFSFEKISLPNHNSKACNFSMLELFICTSELIDWIPNGNVDGVDEDDETLSV